MHRTIFLNENSVGITDLICIRIDIPPHEQHAEINAKIIGDVSGLHIKFIAVDSSKMQNDIHSNSFFRFWGTYADNIKITILATVAHITI